MRAKLSGYLDKPGDRVQSLPAQRHRRCRRATRGPSARFFQGGPGALEAALADFDDAHRATRPDNPYFWEAKGDLLMRAGQNARGDPVRCARR